MQAVKSLLCKEIPSWVLYLSLIVLSVVYLVIFREQVLVLNDFFDHVTLLHQELYLLQDQLADLPSTN